MAAAACLLAVLCARQARADVNRPFGSHPIAYAAGSIRPNHVSQAALDQATADFYDAWKARFLEQTCGTGRYVVKTKTQSGNLTVSEGHGYGMLLEALMAGHDPDAQTIFDGMFAYFREHPTATHDHLMSWYQTLSCSDAQGNDSASDGDLDIAFALLLADKQWGSCGAIDYLAEAKKVIADVKDGDLDPSHRYVLLGDWVSPSDPPYGPSTRTSDFMVDHARSFAAATGDASWTGLLDRTYQIVSSLQSNHSPATGLLPDFATDPLGSPAPAPAGFLEGPNDGAYDYNACRDPWRLATDFLVSGDARAKTAVQRIDAWIKGATGGDPTQIRSGYQLGGSPSPGTDYLSMAFVAPLGVGAMVDSSNQAWLNSIWDLVVATPSTTDGYYENTLKLLAMIVMSGNWWAPERVADGSCTPPGGGPALCPAGGSLTNARIALGGVAGKQTLKLQGSLLFDAGIPAGFPLDGGAQLLIEDLGSGGASVFELTTATAPIPGATASSCDARRDGWKTTRSSVTYRNRSTALDPPACTPGSARGLSLLQYKPEGALEVAVKAQASRATLPAAIAGPLRATVVLGSGAAASQAGACAFSPALSCSGAGSKLRCE